MIDKGKLYRGVEGIVPPILWGAFKKTSLYKQIAKRADRFTSPPPAENVTIETGRHAGLTLRFYPHGVWQTEMRSGDYDKELFSFLDKLPTSGKVIYDVGAHIGFHSLAFARLVGDAGQVITFEPNPVNIVRCKEILALNPELATHISLQEIALGDSVGTTTFLCTNDLEGGSSTGGFVTNASPLWERSVYLEKVMFKEITVTQETIDHLVETNKLPAPDLLKIDVEGAEQLVLGGATHTLTAFKPVVIVEFHSMFSTYRCLQILSECGYTTTILKQEPDGRIMIAATSS